MNPFEAGVVGAAGLNATMARSQALKEFCTVRGRQYQFFYNPMWGHLESTAKNRRGRTIAIQVSR